MPTHQMGPGLHLAMSCTEENGFSFALNAIWV
jgi:hypothetical protein